METCAPLWQVKPCDGTAVQDGNTLKWDYNRTLIANWQLAGICVSSRKYAAAKTGLKRGGIYTEWPIATYGYLDTVMNERQYTLSSSICCILHKECIIELYKSKHLIAHISWNPPFFIENWDSGFRIGIAGFRIARIARIDSRSIPVPKNRIDSDLAGSVHP